jgi:hypothetical protein
MTSNGETLNYSIVDLVESYNSHIKFTSIRVHAKKVIIFFEHTMETEIWIWLFWKPPPAPRTSTILKTDSRPRTSTMYILGDLGSSRERERLQLNFEACNCIPVVDAYRRRRRSWPESNSRGGAPEELVDEHTYTYASWQQRRHGMVRCGRRWLLNNNLLTQALRNKHSHSIPLISSSTRGKKKRD